MFFHYAYLLPEKRKHNSNVQATYQHLIKRRKKLMKGTQTKDRCICINID